MILKDNILVRLAKLEHAVFGNESVTMVEITVSITAPATATNGTFSQDEMTTLLESENNVIYWNDKYYRLYENKKDSGYLVYAHSNTDYSMELITVTISTKSWVFTKG